MELDFAERLVTKVQKILNNLETISKNIQKKWKKQRAITFQIKKKTLKRKSTFKKLNALYTL